MVDYLPKEFRQQVSLYTDTGDINYEEGITENKQIQ